MTKVQILAKALNIALAELRELSQSQRLNSFDSVVQQLPVEARRYVEVDMSPIYWITESRKEEKR